MLSVPQVPALENRRGKPAIDTIPAKQPVATDFGLLAFVRRPMSALLAVFVAVFTVYAPSLNGQFLWDDTLLVKNNLLIRSPLLVFEVFRHTLFGDASNFYRPTQTLTFLADYYFWELNPFGYHLTSVLIHAANAFLLCLVLRQVLPVIVGGTATRRLTDGIALGVALVWAVHPVHSAAVAYISGTADTLAMTFCLGAALLCERALRTSSPSASIANAAGALVCLLLGLCAKEIASIWLLLYLGYLFGLREKTTPRQRWTVVAMAVLALIIYLGLRHLPGPAPVPPPMPKLPPKWVLMLRALGDYGSLLIFPDKLFMERQVFAVGNLASAPDEALYLSLAISGVAMLATFVLGCWWSGQGQVLRRVGVIWFLAGFLPISNLFALNSSVAEHWLYLPSIGFFLFITGVGLDMVPMLRSRRAISLVSLTVGFVIFAFGLRTWYRTFDWMDETTFFRQTIADGGDVFRARANLGVAYSHRAIAGAKVGGDDQGIIMLRDIVRRFPRVVGPRINLANALARSGDQAGAKTILEGVAVDLYARPGGDSHELVTTLRSLDLLEAENPLWPDRRRLLLKRGSQQYPNLWDLVEYNIKDQIRAHHPVEALAFAEQFAATHWWHAPVRIAIGRLEAEANHPAKALAAWKEASRLDVYDAEALSSAAVLCLHDGQLPAAYDLQNRAVRRQPDSPKQHILLAQVLERQNNPLGAKAEVALANTLVEQAEDAP